MGRILLLILLQGSPSRAGVAPEGNLAPRKSPGRGAILSDAVKPDAAELGGLSLDPIAPDLADPAAVAPQVVLQSALPVEARHPRADQDKDKKEEDPPERRDLKLAEGLAQEMTQALEERDPAAAAQTAGRRMDGAGNITADIAVAAVLDPVSIHAGIALHRSPDVETGAGGWKSWVILPVLKTAALATGLATIGSAGEHIGLNVLGALVMAAGLNLALLAFRAFRPPYRGKRRFLLAQAALTASLLLAGGLRAPIEQRYQAYSERKMLSGQEESIARGERRLWELQQPDGSWGVGMSHTKGWDSSYVRLPITAIVLRSLKGAPAPSEEARKRAEEFIFQTLRTDHEILDAEQSRAGNNNQPYTLAFSLSFFLDRWEDPALAAERPATRRAIERVLENIRIASWRYVMHDTGGGTFQTALIAESLLRAKQAGFAMPRRDQHYTESMRLAHDPIAVELGMADPDYHMDLPPTLPLSGEPAKQSEASQWTPGKKDALTAILDNLEGSRQAHGGFPYSAENLKPGKDTEADSAFRSVGIELLLYRAGRSDRAKLRAALDRLMKHHREFEDHILSPENKEVTHDSGRNYWAKYYYYLAMRSAAEALTELKEEPDAPAMARELSLSVLRQQRPDAAWVDSPEASGPAYGTAMAIDVLRMLRPIRER